MEMEDRANVLREMKVCRFCLSNEESQLSSIYEKHSSETRHSVPLPLQIMGCIAIEVFKNDGMPQLICNCCRNLALQAYTFKTNCKKADDALKVFVATGQLSKPYLQKVEPLKMVIPSTPKPVTILNPQASKIHHIEEMRRIKTEDGMEIITLNINADETEDESMIVRQGQNESEEILGYEMDFDDSKRSLEEGEYVNVDGRSHQVAQYDLQKHSLTHHDKKPFSCVLCYKTFTRESFLRRHEKMHDNVPKYVCNECYKTFLTKEYLELHMEKHKKKRPYVCPICNKSFVFKQGLERHEQVHSQNKPHKCNYCEASFNSPIKLTRHITSHAGLRPYPCKICSRTFLLSHHLTRHMRSHYAAQSSKPEAVLNQHKCDICSMSFRRKDSLINHSAIHSMVNLRCVICYTSFESAKAVKEHITTHLAGLPFPCEKCDYSFHTSVQLEEHQLKHAEMEYEEQIEREVISEALEKKNKSNTENSIEGEDEEELEEGEVQEFTITKTADVVLKEAMESNSKSTAVVPFFKNELESEDEEGEYVESAAGATHEQQDLEPEEEPIKPIVRHEGTKMYQRKTPLKRKLPEIQPRPPMDQSDPIQIDDVDHLEPLTLDGLATKKVVNMKMGEKLVKVQKFIVTKEEMKALAKQGILEMKGGRVVLKNAGQSILNATLKPIQKTDIESIIDKKIVRQQIKQYQKKSDRPGEDENSNQEQLQTLFSRNIE